MHDLPPPFRLRICNTAARALLAGAVLLVAGCGSGDDDLAEALPAASTTPSATINQATMTTGGSTVTAASSCSLPQFQASLIAEINRRRASARSCGSRGAFAAAAPLTWNSNLFIAALGHAQDMIAHGFFSHTGSNGSSVADRVAATGYGWSSVAENIAGGQPTVARVVEAWMNSDGHCANVMHPTVTEFAVACVYNPTNQSNYWVMDMARPR
jgi:uncharacterized protein YkwD